MKFRMAFKALSIEWPKDFLYFIFKIFLNHRTVNKTGSWFCARGSHKTMKNKSLKEPFPLKKKIMKFNLSPF